jgi:hypothetical protein
MFINVESATACVGFLDCVGCFARSAFASGARCSMLHRAPDGDDILRAPGTAKFDIPPSNKVQVLTQGSGFSPFTCSRRAVEGQRFSPTLRWTK